MYRHRLRSRSQSPPHCRSRSDTRNSSSNLPIKVGFAPAFARHRTHEEESTRTVAPAFAGRSAREQPSTSDNFSYMANRPGRQEASWSTYDPDTGKRNWNNISSATSAGNGGWASSVASQAADSNLPFYMRAASHNSSEATSREIARTRTLQSDDSSIQPEVAQRFVPVSHIMRESAQSLSKVEAANVSLLGLRTSTKIISTIGDEEIILDRKIDNRAELRDSQGNYIGKNRGKMKKRYEDELRRRREERGKQMELANKIYLEFQALSSQEQQARRDRAAKNRSITLWSLDIEEIDDERVPEIYKVDNIYLGARVRAYNTHNAPGKVDGTNTAMKTAVDVPDIYRIDNSSMVRRINAYNQRPSQRTARIAEGSSSPAPSTEDDQLSFRDDDDSLEASSLVSRSTTAISVPHTPFKLHGQCSRSASRQLPYASSNAKASAVSATSSTASTHTRSRIAVWPELMPFEDCEPAEIEWQGQMTAFVDTQTACARQGRVVCVQLHDARVEYGGAAILDRVFGGAIEALQFFPDERQAVVVFADPKMAKAYLDHVEACSAFNEHEYRRLQISASFYRGTEDNAIYPCIEGISTQMIVNNASRALIVDNINKALCKAELLVHFTHVFQSTGHLVRMRLVVPKKKYEQEGKNSNAAVLEFATVKQAMDAKQLFDAGLVKDLQESAAVYLSDPVRVPRPKMIFCKCLYCTDDDASMGVREGAAPSNAWESASRTSHDIHPTRREFPMATKVARAKGQDYDPKLDARRPSEIERRS